MIKNINHKHLYYFWAVAKQQSFMKAASVLNVSQSSISEQVKILEHGLGTLLFVRSKKGVQLTSDGEKIFKLVSEFFPKLDELFESLINHKSTDVKFLRIGMAPTLSSKVRFAFAYPFIEDIRYTVKLHQGENSYLCHAFENQEIDIILTANEKLNLRLKHERAVLTKKKLVFVMRNSLADKLGAKFSFSKLKFINYSSDSDLHFKIIDYFNQNKMMPIRIAEIDDVSIIKSVLMAMDSFALVPYKTVEDEVERGELKIIKKPISKLQPQITAYYRKELQNELFNKLLKESTLALKALFKD